MAGSISSEVGEALAKLVLQNAALTATVEGLVKILAANGTLTRGQVDALNADAVAAMRRQFGEEMSRDVD